MTIYYTLAGLLTFGSLLYEAILGRTIPLGELNKRQFRGEKAYYFICCIVLTLIVSFRADFWTDAFGYTRIFNTVKRLSFIELFLNTLRLTYGDQIIFLIFTKVISLFTNDPHIYFVIMSILTYLPIATTIFKKSDAPFLSLLLLFTFGFYFSSFNVVRSCMVFGMSTLLLDDIIEKKPLRYIICALALALIHASAIILIPIFFLLQIPLLDRKYTFFTVCGVVVFLFGFDYVFSFFDRFFYDSFYSSGNKYSGINITAGAFGMIVPHLIVLVLLVLYMKYFDANEAEVRILMNGTLIWCIFGVLVFRIRLMTRLSDMMFIYPVLFVPKILLRIKPKLDDQVMIQRLLIFCFFIFIILWRLNTSLKESPFNPYYTFFT